MEYLLQGVSHGTPLPYFSDHNSSWVPGVSVHTNIMDPTDFKLEKFLKRVQSFAYT